MAFNCFNNLFIFHFQSSPPPTPPISCMVVFTILNAPYIFRVVEIALCGWQLAITALLLLLLLTSVSSSSSSHFCSIEFHSVLDTLLLLIINFILCCLRKSSIECIFFVCQEGMDAGSSSSKASEKKKRTSPKGEMLLGREREREKSQSNQIAAARLSTLVLE